MKGEIVALPKDKHILVENYIELHAMHPKMKRSLIPVIGKVLDYLFHSIEQFYDFSFKHDYRRIIKGLKGEIVALL